MPSSLPAWSLTLLLHSAFATGLVLVLHTVVRTPTRRVTLLRLALAAPLVTAPLQVALADARPLDPRVSLAGGGGAGAGARPAPGTAPMLDLQPDPGAGPAGSDQARGEPGRASRAGAPREDATAGERLGSALFRLLPAALGAWVTVAGGLVLALCLRRRRFLAGLARRPLGCPEARTLCAQLGAGPRVHLTGSSRLTTPLALGSREICVPADGWFSLRPDERRALLAHELAHLERRDPQWLLAAQVLERALFVQPLVALVRRRLQVEMEPVADARAVRRTGEPAALARCLASVAAWQPPSDRRGPAFAPGMAPARSALVRRVEGILASPAPEPSRASGAAFTAAVAATLVLFACTAPRVDDGDTRPDSGRAAGDPIDAVRPGPTDPFPLRGDALVVDVAPDGEARLYGSAGDALLGTFDLEARDPGAAGGLVAFRRALEAAAAGFPRGGPGEDGEPTPFDGQLADGTLRIRLQPDSPFHLVQRVMEQCGSKNVLLWDVELATAGQAPEVYPTPLPVDVHPSEERLESDDDAAGERGTVGRIELRLTPEADGSVTLEGPAVVREVHRPRGGDETEGERPGPPEPRLSPHSTLRVPDVASEPARLREYGRELHAAGSELSIVLDVGPGVTFRDVRAVLGPVLQAGFTDIRFVGELR